MAARLLFALLAAGPLFAQDPPRGAVGAWDTGASSAAPYGEAVLAARDGWKAAGAGEALRGDAVITNGRLLAVARKQGAGLELYSLGSGKPILRGRLLAAGASGIEKVAVSESGRSAAALEVAWKGVAIRFRLKKGDNFVEAVASSGDPALRLECPSRFAVLPDFFADDILFDARKVPVDRVELPSENFVLHFAGKGDAIVMGVFENREQDVKVTLAGKAEAREISGSEIAFGKKGSKVWVSVLEGPGMWHSLDVTEADKKKVMPLDWTMPFVAQWRVDWTRKDGLTDSWDMLLPDKEGDGYIKPSWLAQDGKISDATRTATGEVDRDAYKPGGPASDRLGPERKRWTTVLGQVLYPCWSDKERKGYLQPLEHKRLVFDGPVVIYPLTRLADTPVDAFTPVDVVRNTMGVGPCQYILDVEGQKQEHVGRATCHVRTLLGEVYGAGQQKARRADVDHYLNDALDFVTHIRNRILSYVEFGKELRAWLAAQKAAHPELKDPLESLEALAKEIDDRVSARLEQLRIHKMLQGVLARATEAKIEITPPNLAAQLNREFRSTLLDYEGADWKDRIKKEYTDPLTAIGGAQDEMVGECRWVVKGLRQKAGILLATDPAMGSIAAEVRARTQKMLRGGAAYEGGRH